MEKMKGNRSRGAGEKHGIAREAAREEKPFFPAPQADFFFIGSPPPVIFAFASVPHG